MAFRILAIGQLVDHNQWRAESFKQLGCSVTYVDTRRWARHSVIESIRQRAGIRAPSPLRRHVGKVIARLRPEIVWVDKGVGFSATDVGEWKTLHDPLIVQYHPDDWLNPIYSLSPSRDAVAAYDVHVVPRPVMVTELKLAGAKEVYKSRFSYEPTIHHPSAPPPSRVSRILFVGRADPDRVERMRALARHGVPVTAVGPGFALCQDPALAVVPRHVLGLAYAEMIQAAAGTLGLLARQSRDQHTCRSVEIPACGGLLLAERTPEHLEMFAEGREALFFSSDEEMIFQASRVISRPDEVARIAAAGRARASRSKYDHRSEAARLLAFLKSVR